MRDRKWYRGIFRSDIRNKLARLTNSTSKGPSRAKSKNFEREGRVIKKGYTNRSVVYSEYPKKDAQYKHDITILNFVVRIIKGESRRGLVRFCTWGERYRRQIILIDFSQRDQGEFFLKFHDLVSLSSFFFFFYLSLFFLSTTAGRVLIDARSCVRAFFFLLRLFNWDELCNVRGMPFMVLDGLHGTCEIFAVVCGGFHNLTPWRQNDICFEFLRRNEEKF